MRDLGGSDFIDVGLRNAIARGLTPGPRMLVAVKSIDGDHWAAVARLSTGVITVDRELVLRLATAAAGGILGVDLEREPAAPAAIDETDLIPLQPRLRRRVHGS